MIDERIINEYLLVGSVKETAENLGISVVKVRRTLITAGLWSSRSSEAILDLYEEGLTVNEIAEVLHITPKGVEAYLPYRDGPYAQEERSQDAERCDRYRRRKRFALETQIHRNSGDVGAEIGQEEKRMANQCRKTVHLHMELVAEGLGNREMGLLYIFGKVKKTLSRDVLVPSSMTLHALHYVILRLFGWQNSHLHNFALPEPVFEMLTKGMFRRWGELCGIYFRMPSEDWEDIYWDDDYDGKVSFRSWLRKKYQGPYHYGGNSELYIACQRELQNFYKNWETVDIRVPFEKIMADPECDVYEKTIAPQDATIDEMYRSIDMGGTYYELLERLTLEDIMLLNGEELPIIEGHLIEAVPVTNELVYSYDYGDGWEVKITVVPNSEQAERHPEVAEDEKPLCIAQDGLNVMDDVGGIYGYCEFLEELHLGDAETRESMREWSRMQGWTGRRQKLENVL